MVTDRQTDKFFDTIYKGKWIFSFSFIFYLPTRFARRGIIYFSLVNDEFYLLPPCFVGRVLHPVGAIRCCKGNKITAPPNVWHNIPLGT